jgi:hypothetical protein
MRKRIVLTGLAAVLLAAPAAAKDMNGKFGVGFDQSFGGVSGINLKYFIGDFALWLTPGLDLYHLGGTSSTGVKFDVGVAGIYNFARSDQANLGTGLRVDVGYMNGDSNGGSETWQVNLEIPLIGEYFLTDHFAIHLGVGLVLSITPTSGSTLAVPNAPVQASATAATAKAKPSGTSIGFTAGAAGVMGSGGFTFYF